MATHDISFLDPAALRAQPRKISPTDISQFIRLDQCERYLRLRLHERVQGQRFLYDYGVAPESIPPILTQSGAEFEQTIEAQIGQHAPTHSCKPSGAGQMARGNDNARLIAVAQNLAPGAVTFVFQPRLEVDLDGWFVRGDVDIVRLERDAAGDLHLIIADMKSSTSAKLEHRLQVAFYHEMIERLFRAAGVRCPDIRTAVLYRGPNDTADQSEPRALAQAVFHTDAALLELVPSPEDYRDAVRDLVTHETSVAARVASAPFDALSFHLGFKCDGCLYNSFCMKRSAEQDDLSLLPHLHKHDKKALQKHGVTTTRQLATLKAFATPDGTDLAASPGQGALVRQLATTWPVGPRLEELVHRARRYRAWKRDELRALSYIPSKGYGSLPYVAPDHNPNLVTVFLDAQFDYLHDRVYMLGALVVGHEDGVATPERRHSVVAMTEGPPETPEQEQALLVDWLSRTIAAIVAAAAPDADGLPNAPIHLVFFNSLAQQILLDCLARHFVAVVGATPLYDFMTQIAAFDSSLLSYLDQEIREHKNYPMICQSLQAVAAYLRFDWNADAPFREIFYRRMFDFWSRNDAAEPGEQWYTGRSRFTSHIPLEYAYAAWDALPPSGSGDAFGDYRRATGELLLRLHARRLEAMEHIAQDFRGNRQTIKTAFALPDLATFHGTARTLAQALAEFVTIERHVELSAWKTARLAPPEQRVLAGASLLVRYRDADQDPQLLAVLQENSRRGALEAEYRAAYFAANPTAKKFKATNEQKAAIAKLPLPGPYRLRIEVQGLDCDLEQALLLTSIRAGDRMLIAPRWSFDERLPEAERVPFQPTPKQLLYATRGDIGAISVDRDAEGRARAAWVELTISDTGRNAPKGSEGFVFNSYPKPLLDGQLYTLDEDPNSWYGYWCAAMVDAVRDGGANTLYTRLTEPDTATVTWPQAAAAAQARFLAGIDALHAAGVADAPAFRPEVRAYISDNGGVAVLLVQGPPGTGKSYTSAFALFARLQGALAANQPCRVLVSCKTHAATDVLLGKLVEMQQLLRAWQAAEPELFTCYFDARLLQVPCFRMRPREALPAGVIALERDGNTPKGTPKAMQAIQAAPWCVIAATPGGTYGLLKDAFKSLTGTTFADCVVLDEASQMNLPEALLAAAPLHEDGQLIVVGDHRQMPPIVKHDWTSERRRTFAAYRAYESLFVTLRELRVPMIKFTESFRLHADMAAFLRREIYAQDGIDYFSQRTSRLPAQLHADPFVAQVLDPDYPLTVIVHDEDQSQQQNMFEQTLMTPLLVTLADPQGYALDPEHGLGVVVPHRAQRAALQAALPMLSRRDAATDLIALSAVDTVERFQGGERRVIVVSATESDRDYLRAAGDFLLDPRRLNVALSRAKQKLILVASRSVFTTLSTDEETFANAQIWKNLLRRTCTTLLWRGMREGVAVEVWGNTAATASIVTEDLVAHDIVLA